MLVNIYTSYGIISQGTVIFTATAMGTSDLKYYSDSDSIPPQLMPSNSSHTFFCGLYISNRVLSNWDIYYISL